MSRTPFVYLAQPIDFAAPRWNLEVSEALRAAELGVYMPNGAFRLPDPVRSGPVISNINRHALTECEALVAVLPDLGTPSFGVPMEIEQARSEGKPTYLVGDLRVYQRSWALKGLDPNRFWFTQAFSVHEARHLAGVINKDRNGVRVRGQQVHPLQVRVDEGGRLPERAYTGDAGYDLYTVGDHLLAPGENYDIPCGISVQLPDTMWAMITGRSSTLRKHNLLVNTNIIDSGYRGPLFAVTRNMGPDPVKVEDGQRIAQLIPFPLTAAQTAPVQVDALDPSDRGTAGFGSSGA